MKRIVAEKVARLRQINLFRRLTPGELRILAGVAEIARYSPGDIVVREGDEGDSLYVVTSGLLRARRWSEDGDVVLGEIQKGEFFGEFGFFEAEARTATVEAVSLTSVLRLSREVASRNFAVRPEIEGHLRATLELRRAAGNPPFPPTAEARRGALATMLGIDAAAALDAVAENVEWVWLPGGEDLIREGEAGDAVYFVLDGQLRVFTERDGRSVFIGLVSPGESVGEMALLSGAPRSASVSAETSTQLLRLSRDAFDEILSSHPERLADFRDLVLLRVAQRARSEAAWERTGARAPVTLRDCAEVLRTRDLSLRNLKITQNYHRLALDLADVLGPEDVNWPAFGAFASRSAGYAIRKEEAPLVLGALRGLGAFSRLARRFGAHSAASELASVIDRVLDYVSEAVSDGNLRIFGDMAPVMVRFGKMMRAGAASDPRTMAAFCRTLKPGPSEMGGQDLLGLALTAWYEAQREASPKRRAELMLLGNIRVALHEQIRIQTDLEQALGAPLLPRVGDEFARTVDALAASLPEGARHRLRKRAQSIETMALDVIARGVRRVITRRMIRMRLPSEDLWLGVDVPSPRNGSIYPPDLQELTHPDLIELVSRFARDAGSLAGSAAMDWANLEDRMNYVVHLFRSRQKDPALYTPPLEGWRLDALPRAWYTGGSDADR